MINYRLIFFIFLFSTNISNAQKLYDNFDKIAINSVETLLNLNSSFQTDHYSEYCQYFVFRVLKYSKRKNIEFYIEQSRDGELLKNLNPNYYIEYKDNIRILIFDDSERNIDLPLYYSDSVFICKPDYLIDISNSNINFVATPIIYQFNAKLVSSKKNLVELSYSFVPIYKVSINDRPIRKYIDTRTFIKYDTIRSYYLKNVQSRYEFLDGRTIAIDKLNIIKRGKMIISVRD